MQGDPSRKCWLHTVQQKGERAARGEVGDFGQTDECPVHDFGLHHAVNLVTVKRLAILLDRKAGYSTVPITVCIGAWRNLIDQPQS